MVIDARLALAVEAASRAGGETGVGEGLNSPFSVGAADELSSSLTENEWDRGLGFLGLVSELVRRECWDELVIDDEVSWAVWPLVVLLAIGGAWGAG